MWMFAIYNIVHMIYIHLHLFITLIYIKLAGPGVVLIWECSPLVPHHKGD